MWSDDYYGVYRNTSSFMIYLCLFIYYAQIIVMLVLNLNLLIAIISENYDKVRSYQQVARVKEKTEMILEAVVHKIYKLKHITVET